MEDTLVQPITFTGGLNTDLDLKNIKPGDYVTALNFRNVFTENGVDGSGENISSNIQVAYTLPSGTNKCIGVYEDIVNYTTFYFIWNSNGKHQILRYYPENTGVDDKIQIILGESYTNQVVGDILNFSEWGYITHSNLVGDLYYWTQGDNPQRYINVIKANKYQKLPKFKICFEVPISGSSVINYHFQNLNGGGTVAAFNVTFTSPTSRAAMAADAYAAFVVATGMTTHFDIVNEGDYLLLTEKILPAIYSNTDIVITQISGTTHSWYIADNWYPSITLKTLDPVVHPLWLEPQTTLANDPALTTNSLNGNAYQFAVRIYGADGRQSVLSKMSRMTYFDQTDTIGDSFYHFVNLTNYLFYDQSGVNLNTIKVDYKDDGRLFENRELISRVEILVRNLNTDPFKSIALINDYELDGVYNFYNNTAGVVISPNDNVKQWDNIPIYSECQEVVNNKLFYSDNTLGYDTPPINATQSCAYEVPSWDTKMVMRPKYFGRYKTGIVYFDRYGRNSFVARSSANEVTILPPYKNGVIYNENRPIVRWAINSQPPDWATHYAWVRTKDLVHQYYTFIMWKYVLGTVALYYDIDGNAVSFGAGTAITAQIALEPKTVYTFTDGDIMRVVLFDPFPGGLYSSQLSAEVLKYEIVAGQPFITIAYNLFTNPSLPDFNSITPSHAWFMQVYSPHKEVESETYYEFGECYEVGDAGLPTRYHKGGFQGTDQIVGTNPALGVFYVGWDTFHIPTPHTDPTPFSFINETQSSNVTTNKTFTTQDVTTPDNTVQSIEVMPTNWDWSGGVPNPVRTSQHFKTQTLLLEQTNTIYSRDLITGIGRPNAVVVTNKQTKDTDSIVFSNPYNIGTNYNGFGTFELLNSSLVPAGYGGVRKLLNVENILLAICVSKTFSIYVDKGILQTNPGQALVSNTTGVVLGALRYLDGSHGTVNPESFATTGNLAFWWDAYNGEVCQYSPNGIDVVSRFGMKNHFAQKGAIGIKSNLPTYKVLGVLHGQFNEYILAFNQIVVNEVTYPAETIGFSYLGNKWNCNYSYIPEQMVATSVDIITFHLGQIWLHKTNASKNIFYGNGYNREVTAVANQNMATNKTFISLSVEGNKVPELVVPKTPVTDLNLAGQESELNVLDFEFINGSYFASFLNNKLTPNFIDPEHALIDGDPMQGQTMTLLFKSSAQTFEKITSAEVYYIPDQLTNG